jgi:hypothetical protein
LSDGIELTGGDMPKPKRESSVEVRVFVRLKDVYVTIGFEYDVHPKTIELISLVRLRSSNADRQEQQNDGEDEQTLFHGVPPSETQSI